MRTTRPRTIATCAAVLAGILLWETRPGLGSPRHSSNPPDPASRELAPGQTVERELSAGQSHRYGFHLAAGHFVHLVAEQHGIDLAMTFFGPDGRQLETVDAVTGSQGSEHLYFVCEIAGPHRLEIRTPAAASGSYRVRLDELRPATARDRDRATAGRAFSRAARLQAERTAESMRRASDGFHQALTYWRRARDPRGEADTLERLAFIAWMAGEPKRAAENLHQALALWRSIGDRRRQAEALDGLGAVHIQLGEAPISLEYLDQALRLWRQERDAVGEAGTLTNLGVVHARRGEPRQALELYEQVLALWRSIGDRTHEAITLNNMGKVYDDLGEPRQALRHYEEALPLRRALGDRRGEAHTLNNAGMVYAKLGEPRAALDHYRKALPLRRTVGDPRGEADTLNNLGVVLSRGGDFQAALDHYRRALVLRREVDDRGGEATTLHNLGVVYERLGEPDEALEHYRQAIALAGQLGDRANEASALHSMSRTYAGLDEQAPALRHARRALALRRAVEDRLGEAETLHLLGSLFLRAGDPEEALRHYRQALPLKQAVGNRRGEADVLHALGRVYALRGEQNRAYEHLHRALPLRRAVGDPEGEAATLHALARLERDRGDLAGASTLASAALDLVESVRATIVGETLRATFLATKQDYYELAVDVLMRRHAADPRAGHDAAALALSERARARSLLETLAAADADGRQGVDRELLERERALSLRINAKAYRLRQGMSGELDAPTATAELKSELTDLIARWEETRALIRSTNPRASVLHPPLPLAVETLQDRALDEQTVLLVYTLGADRSWLWVLTPSSLTSAVLPPRDEIEAVARRLYQLLTARNRQADHEDFAQRQERLARDDADYRRTAAELSRMLLSPVAGELDRGRLVVVSDGMLQYIPFAALPAPADLDSASTAGSATVPLVVSHEIVNLPSASLLAIQRREPGRRPATDGQIAVLADPVFAADDPRVRGRDSAAQAGSAPVSEPAASQRADAGRRLREVTGLSFPRLRQSRDEARAILGLTPVEESFSALDFAASRRAATSPLIGRYRFVHFATHGVLDSRHPQLSGLVMSLVDESGQPQDGFLRLHDVYNLKLGAELVVLSACRTALGREIRGEGLVGLTRGFLYAGAEAVIASLWRVQDRATAELMKRLYRGLLEDRLPPAAALRQAQISMWNDEPWRAPYYWSGFILQGDWRAALGRTSPAASRQGATKGRM